MNLEAQPSVESLLALAQVEAEYIFTTLLEEFVESEDELSNNWFSAYNTLQKTQREADELQSRIDALRNALRGHPGLSEKQAVSLVKHTAEPLETLDMNLLHLHSRIEKLEENFEKIESPLQTKFIDLTPDRFQKKFLFLQWGKVLKGIHELDNPIETCYELKFVDESNEHLPILFTEASDALLLLHNFSLGKGEGTPLGLPRKENARYLIGTPQVEFWNAVNDVLCAATEKYDSFSTFIDQYPTSLTAGELPQSLLETADQQPIPVDPPISEEKPRDQTVADDSNATSSKSFGGVLQKIAEKAGLSSARNRS